MSHTMDMIYRFYFKVESLIFVRPLFFTGGTVGVTRAIFFGSGFIKFTIVLSELK